MWFISKKIDDISHTGYLPKAMLSHLHPFSYTFVADCLLALFRPCCEFYSRAWLLVTDFAAGPAFKLYLLRWLFQLQASLCAQNGSRNCDDCSLSAYLAYTLCPFAQVQLIFTIALIARVLIRVLPGGRSEYALLYRYSSSIDIALMFLQVWTDGRSGYPLLYWYGRYTNTVSLTGMCQIKW